MSIFNHTQHLLNKNHNRQHKKFSQYTTDTRELTADDFIYQIKRLAEPRLHSPIYGFFKLLYFRLS